MKDEKPIEIIKLSIDSKAYKTTKDQYDIAQKQWLEQMGEYYFKDQPKHVVARSPLYLQELVESIINELNNLKIKTGDPTQEDIAYFNKMLRNMKSDNKKDNQPIDRGRVRFYNEMKMYKHKVYDAWIKALKIIQTKLKTEGKNFPELYPADLFYGITMNYDCVQVVIARNDSLHPHPFKYGLVNGLPLLSIPIDYVSIKEFCADEKRKTSVSTFFSNLRAGNIRAVRRGGPSSSWFVSSCIDPRSTANKRQDYQSVLYHIKSLETPLKEFLDKYNMYETQEETIENKKIEIKVYPQYIRIWQPSTQDYYIAETYYSLPQFGENANYKDFYQLNEEGRRVFEDHLLSYFGITPLFDIPIKHVYLSYKEDN